MSEASLHIPVMLDEVICALAPADNGLFIDATFGNGGYSRAILSSAACSVAAIDKILLMPQMTGFRCMEAPSRRWQR